MPFELDPRNRAKFERLQHLPFLSRAGGDHIAHLVRTSSELRLRPGRVLARAGEASPDIFLIIGGNARSYIDGVPARRLGPGCLIGTVVSGDNEPDPQSETIVAETTVQVLKVTSDRSRSMLAGLASRLTAPPGRTSLA